MRDLFRAGIRRAGTRKEGEKGEVPARVARVNGLYLLSASLAFY